MWYAESSAQLGAALGWVVARQSLPERPMVGAGANHVMVLFDGFP
jgi:hypothetical protein